MNLSVKNKLLVLTLLMLFGWNAYADQEHFFNSIKGAHFAADSSVTVKDDKYQTPLWAKIQKNMSCTDIVTLQLNEDTSLFLSAPHSCRVDLEIYYYVASGGEDSITKTLYINYDTAKGKTFTFSSSFKFSGGYKVTSKILAVYYDSVLSVSYPKVFELNESILIDRVYTFFCGPPPLFTPSADISNQKFTMVWLPEIGADEYDLEWTFYDDSSSVVKYDFPNNYTSFSFLYKNNATRVTVDGNSYTISLVYNPGYIFFRVRGVHYDTLGHRVEGPWSSDAFSMPLISYSTIYGFHWHGHEDSINWQYTAAYAEEGKRKEIVDYFDGSLRNRQSVTLNNTEQKAIVGETIYDYAGRPAVTTLPAPIDSNKIVYYNLFNVDPSDSEFNRKDFDTGGCGNPPIGMDSLHTGMPRGSSGYYSSSNLDRAFEFNAFLPDAQGYPYSQIEYTPDMTGRIARQSLPGKTHYLGSGHETKYYYGKPAQEELDRLFGNEVGNNSHYLKNMVIDPNGQVSVSYVDANGKTIATALAGSPPPNLQSLPSYYSQTSLNINLLDTNGYRPTNTSVLSSYSLLATNTGNYQFTYQLLPTHFFPDCSYSFCTDCIYDIQLVITPACGGASPIIVHHDTNFTYKETFDTTCIRDSNVIDNFTVYLDPGEYNVTRLITVDQGAINFYTQWYLLHNTCPAKYDNFLNSATANIDFTGCNMDCQTCLTQLGTQASFTHKYITQLQNAHEAIHHSDTVTSDTLYKRAVADCEQMCPSSNICSSLYQEMLADVSPGGQYCQYDTTGGIYHAMDSTSVLFSDYMNPGIFPYVNDSGRRDSVWLAPFKRTPQSLTVTEFVQNWQPSWAASLVQFHPEYCYYKYCIMDSASNRYDAAMEATATYTAAYTAGYLNSLDDPTPSLPNGNDPYFKSGGLGNVMRTALKTKIDSFVTIVHGSPMIITLWQTAALAVLAEADTLSGSSITYPATLPTFGSGCAGNLNMEWNFFKGVYLSMKQRIQDSLENVYVSNPVNNCSHYVECIGDTLCDGSHLYLNKVPRHITPEQFKTDSILANWTSPAAAITTIKSAEQAQADTTCKSYAYAWMQELSGCGTLTTAQQDSIVAGMEEICELGWNINHPFGSSNTPGYAIDSRGDRDFEDVLVRVLGTSRGNLSCDSLNIPMPPPYIDSNGVAGAPITYYRPSNCMCTYLDTLHNRYRLDSTHLAMINVHRYKDFADYLNKKFGGNLVDSTIYTIMNLCANTGCFFASYTLQLPIWMTCCTNPQYTRHFSAGSWDTTVTLTQGCCIQCSDIKIGMRLFEEKAPSAISYPNYQDLLSAFLNNLFGFNLSYQQYITFYDSCSNIPSNWQVQSNIFLANNGTQELALDSTLGNITIVDTLDGYVNNWKLLHRHVYGENSDSIPLTLCNQPLNTVPPSVDTSCLSQLFNDAAYSAQNAYNEYVDSMLMRFRSEYITHCMNIDDSFHVTAPFEEYHYTLYYYDQAGNLVKTLPPQGVHPITSLSSLDSVTKFRAGVAGYHPVYPNGDSLASLYWFNVVNAPIQQATPDGNITNYWYDKLGRLVLSQNKVQAPYLYSYTEYDALNRIIEVGQLNLKLSTTVYSSGPPVPGYTLPLTDDSVESLAKNPAKLSYWLAHTFHTQVTHTYYDSVEYHGLPFVQQNLRKRISSIIYEDAGSLGSIYDTLTSTPTYTVTYMAPATQTNFYNNAIHYSYDIEGNVATILTDDRADSVQKQRYKRTDYYYDLVSGKVNEIIYQHDSIDQFMQAYQYDADNRITDVQTSHDSLYWENDADYTYYWHGPLAREIIGQRQVQGIDYAYTLNGWIKGVNSTILNPTYDMGGDGDVNGANNLIGRDAYGYTLDYFQGDYRPIGGNNFEAQGLSFTGLYNGNIADAEYSIRPLQPKTIAYAYNYDQLNRIRTMQAYIHPDTVHNNWSTVTGTRSFSEAENYDENGNISTYVRHGDTIVGPLAMDSLNYNYYKGTNQLSNVRDAVSASNYPNDIDDEPSQYNYRYNAIGQLAKDSAGGLDTIAWTIYGKVKKIVKANSDSIVFIYDPLGNRLEKRVYTNVAGPGPASLMTTIYSRDAQGNILAVYTKRATKNLRLTEWDIYGTKRLGTIDTNLLMSPYSPPTQSILLDSMTISYLENQKQYELTNHLGNVLATVSDRKWAIDTTSTPNVTNYYVPNVINAQDYYPFGMVMPGRSYQLIHDSSYRFGFNGKLHDDDIWGKGNSYDYGARMYNLRLGRFLSVDPIASKYPELSSYQYASNTPIQGIDRDGKEVLLVGKQESFGVILDGYVEYGIAIGRDGVYAYETVAAGVSTDISVASSVEITYYPTMPGVQNAKGWSFAAGVSGGDGLVVGGGGVYCDPYFGGYFSYGIGGSISPLSSSANDSYTWIQPISELAKHVDATVVKEVLTKSDDFLDRKVTSLQNQANTLNSQNLSLTTQNNNLKGKLNTLTGKEAQNAQNQIKQNDMKINTNNATMNELGKTINGLKETKSQVDSELKKLNQDGTK